MTDTKQKVWQIDEATYLTQTENGLFKIWWAGCYMGPADELVNLVTEPLLSECQELIKEPPTHKESDNSQFDVEIGGYGEPTVMDFVDFTPLVSS